jgi:hypothetical protein
VTCGIIIERSHDRTLQLPSAISETDRTTLDCKREYDFGVTKMRQTQSKRSTPLAEHLRASHLRIKGSTCDRFCA